MKHGSQDKYWTSKFTNLNKGENNGTLGSKKTYNMSRSNKYPVIIA